MIDLKRCRFFGHTRNTALTAELTVEPRAKLIAQAKRICMAFVSLVILYTLNILHPKH